MHPPPLPLPSRCTALHCRDAAERLISELGDPADALAKALAKLCGFKDMKARSLLTAHDDCTTLHFVAEHEVSGPGNVWGYLRKVRARARVYCMRVWLSVCGGGGTGGRGWQ